MSDQHPRVNVIGSHRMTWTTGAVTLVAAATADVAGAATVTIEPPIRKQINSASVVAWDKPLGYYRMVGTGFGWGAVPGALLTEGFETELLEDFG